MATTENLNPLEQESNMNFMSKTWNRFVQLAAKEAKINGNQVQINLQKFYDLLDATTDSVAPFAFCLLRIFIKCETFSDLLIQQLIELLYNQVNLNDFMQLFNLIHTIKPLLNKKTINTLEEIIESGEIGSSLTLKENETTNKNNVSHIDCRAVNELSYYRCFDEILSSDETLFLGSADALKSENSFWEQNCNASDNCDRLDFDNEDLYYFNLVSNVSERVLHDVDSEPLVELSLDKLFEEIGSPKNFEFTVDLVDDKCPAEENILTQNKEIAFNVEESPTIKSLLSATIIKFGEFINSFKQFATHDKFVKLSKDASLIVEYSNFAVFNDILKPVDKPYIKKRIKKIIDSKIIRFKQTETSNEQLFGDIKQTLLKCHTKHYNYGTVWLGCLFSANKIKTENHIPLMSELYDMLLCKDIRNVGMYFDNFPTIWKLLPLIFEHRLEILTSLSAEMLSAIDELDSKSETFNLYACPHFSHEDDVFIFVNDSENLCQNESFNDNFALFKEKIELKIPSIKFTDEMIKYFMNAVKDDTNGFLVMGLLTCCLGYGHLDFVDHIVRNRSNILGIECAALNTVDNFELPPVSIFSNNLPSSSKTTSDVSANGLIKYDGNWIAERILNLPSPSEFGSFDEVVDIVTNLLKSDIPDSELFLTLSQVLGGCDETTALFLTHRKEICNTEKPRKSKPFLKFSKSHNSGPTIASQVTVVSEREKQLEKELRKEEKRARNKGQLDSDDEDDPRVRKKVELGLAQVERIFPGGASASTSDQVLMKLRPSSDPDLPHVYKKRFAGVQTSMLPEGTKKKKYGNVEEINIPPNEPTPVDIGQLVPVNTLDDIAKQVFEGVDHLNRIQSIIYETAYNTNENLLICAPTGAGKTNVALLTVCHILKENFVDGLVLTKNFKIVYISPMKALAAEMTRTFSKKLKCMNVTVRELTGDMQLSRSEIRETTMLVTTPEKWDVVTRKPDDESGLLSEIGLVIIDEVHLLHGDRGPVIEALVARTLRTVESSQCMIRLVGLSATLPNYIDVAHFLKVNPMKGLFFFDQRFRPVPLEHTFIGVSTHNQQQEIHEMDEACYNKVVEALRQDKQVMVFVHSRKATVQTAMMLRNRATNTGTSKLFEPTPCAGLLDARRKMENSNFREVKELFRIGIAVHHAGMLRITRSSVEKYFMDGYIRVLVCTATLAWGVNLPAHTVIIRGTDVYVKGSYTDLDILDVQQIFGRAGRPQFDTSGHGIIITKQPVLHKYISLMLSQCPIESNFVRYLEDNLNAEIVLGTVHNVEEAVMWLSYTYFYIRMRLSPLAYGINYNEVISDPFLVKRRQAIIIDAAKRLDNAKLIRFNDRTGDFTATDYGRISSHFYIKYATIEVFNELMQDLMTEGELLDMIAHAQEFEQLKVREEELDELNVLLDEYCQLAVPGGTDTVPGKVNILLQTYLSRGSVGSFSLSSDMMYVNQNVSRISRALFEIYLRKNNAIMAGRLLKLSKMFDGRQWDFETPLRQFNCISQEVILKIERQKLTMDRIRDMDVKEIGSLIRDYRLNKVVKKCADEFPNLEIEATLQPITRTVLRISIRVRANFTWNPHVNGSQESFWVWIEDPDYNNIYHSEHFVLSKRMGMAKSWVELFITIPLTEPLPNQYYIRFISERWVGCELYETLSFANLVLPATQHAHTDLLPLSPLPVTALKNYEYESLYSFTFFNPIQTQIFHTMYHHDVNVLLGAPTGSGKTIVAELAMFRLFTRYPEKKIVYVAPLKALVRERVADWKSKFEQKLRKRVVEMTGDVTPSQGTLKSSSIIVTTPEKWDVVSRSWEHREYVKSIGLVIIDEIHLLGEERGPVLEVIVSRTNFISSRTGDPVRIIGLSTALANADDLATWLQISSRGLYNFRPAVRPVPIEVHISGFSGRNYCPRMASMNRPAFQAIREHSPNNPSLIFVSSRRQTRLTAIDLISYLGCDDNPKQWLHMDELEMEQVVSRVHDTALKHTLLFGVGIHHAGLQETDRQIVEELYLHQKIQVLVATATLAWGVNFPARLVVIKGTEYYDGKKNTYVDMPITDVLQMMGRAGRPQFDDLGIACVFVHDIKKNFYKKFLYEPFPVESQLLPALPNHLYAEIVSKSVICKSSAEDFLSWTYFCRRLVHNPGYYGLHSSDDVELALFLRNLVEETVATLVLSRCVEVDETNFYLRATMAAEVGSIYYLAHQTVKLFVERLAPTNSMEEILEILTDSYEFDQVPVRHNEDDMNKDLARNCEIQIKGDMGDPHTKTLILLQAHLSRLEMPCSDYYIDLKLVLDQAMRILQAMLDYSERSGWFQTAKNIIVAIQMLVQSCWFHQSVYLQCPYLGFEHIVAFERLQKQLNPNDENRVISLPSLLTHARKDKQNVKILMRNELNDLNEKHFTEIVSFLFELPYLKVNFSLHGQFYNSDSKTEVQVRQPLKEWLQVMPDADYELKVSLTRLTVERKKKETVVPKCRLSREKQEGWQILLASDETEELLKIKRAFARSRKSDYIIHIHTPSRTGRLKYNILLMSDSYMGLDQQYSLKLEVVR